MNRYICTSCGKFCYSAASPESARSDKCPYPGCNGHVVLAPEGQKIYASTTVDLTVKAGAAK